LTNGGNAIVRNRESIKALRTLGVTDVRFLGDDIDDGFLVEQLGEAYQRLSAIDADVVYCLAFEGGHQDHDASHLAAAVLAARRNVPCYELSLYRSTRHFFRVFDGTGERRRITLSESARALRLVACYPSQWRTFVGLFPEAFLKLVILRRETVRRVDVAKLTRPHDGPLLYERRFGFSFDRFEQAARRFLAARASD